MLFVGLDGEMSGTEIDLGGRLIQIGLSVRTAGAFQSIAFLLQPQADMVWDEKAAAVHQITLTDLQRDGIGQDDADTQLAAWLIDKGADPTNRAKTVPVGFNITGFDMPFVKRQLPKTYALLSRRTAELNGMLWLLDGKNGLGFEQWKKKSLAFAKGQLEDYKPHDAEWDAKRHLLCFEYLRSVILG